MLSHQLSTHVINYSLNYFEIKINYDFRLTTGCGILAKQLFANNFHTVK